MNITEVHVHPITQTSSLVGFAHVIIEHSLMIGSIAIHKKRNGGYRITYPQKGKGYVFHPISKPFGQMIELLKICMTKRCTR